MKYNKILCFGIILALMVSMAGLVNALENDYVYVSTAIEHESDPDIYGRYVVWRVSMDMPAQDGVCSWDEPSWIMLKNTITDEVFNISEAYEVGVYRTATYYHHAEQPHVYGTKVIYTTETGIVEGKKIIIMYDITTNTTTIVPTISQLPTVYATAIYEIDIYEEWIAIGTLIGGKHRIYAYNYEADMAKVILGTDITLNAIGGLILDDYKVYYSEETTGLVRSLCIYNLNEYIIAKIEPPPGIHLFSSGGADYNYMGYTFINTSGTYPTVIDTDFIDWEDTVNYTGFPPIKIHNYEDSYIQENITILDTDLTLTYSNIYITRYEVVYNTNIGDAYKIMVYDIKYNETWTLLNSNYAHVISNVWEDVLVWETNENSLVPGVYTDFRINTDIYRTVTEIEAASSSIGAFIPVAIIIMFVGAMFMIIRKFSGGGESF